MFGEFASPQRTKYIIKHYEQASFSNMEVGVFHTYAYPFVLIKWLHKLYKKKQWQINFPSYFSLLPFLFLHLPFLLQFLLLLFLFFLFLFSPSAYVNPYWLVMDVLGVGEEGDPWKTPKSRWNVAKMKIKARRALGNEGFWWRWRVEVELWYGRWLQEMKENVSHVCSQNNRRVEWSQHIHSIRNFKSSNVQMVYFWLLYVILKARLIIGP